MQSITEKHNRFETRIAKWEEAILVLSFIIMIVASFWQVVSRYALGTPLQWTEELARYMMIIITFVGSANALFRDEHITVDVITTTIKSSLAQEAIRLVSDIVVAAFCIAFAIWSLIYIPQVKASGLISPGLSISMVWPVAGMAIGAILMAIHSTSQVIRWFFDRQNQSLRGDDDV